MKDIEKLLQVVQDNPKYNGFFRDVDWKYYTDGLSGELQEVIDDMENQRYIELQEELGDLLWVTLSLIEKLHHEKHIDRDKICAHTRNKFLERLPFVRDQIDTSRTDIEE